MGNRLNLDFSLSTNTERSNFLNQYIEKNQHIFQKYPLTEEELETMADYLLWGKDSKTGLNSKQSGDINLESRHKTWDSDQHVQSLDALLESPTFNEASLNNIGTTQFKTVRENFSRKDALANASEDLREVFSDLFRRIDSTELKLNFYEVLHGKRTTPPRDKLLNKFSEEERAQFQSEVLKWNQFRYLKNRHYLVEMRREQYSLKDSYATPIAPATTLCLPIEDVDFEEGIEVLPLGLAHSTEASEFIFREFSDLVPDGFGEEQLEIINKFYWRKEGFAPSGMERFFDFREVEHVYQIFQMWEELGDVSAEEAPGLSKLVMTLRYYIAQSELEPIYQDILDMKVKKVKNSDIAFEVNHKYGKSYTPNYISTIFRQRIIPRINETAKYHKKVVENLYFPEEFKTCSQCGRTLLRDSVNFTRKARSKDGFTTKCKRCEKMNRENGIEVIQ